MGLDASVQCRCWQDGLCDPPASLAMRLWYDPETAEVNQTTPENLSVEDTLARDLEFDRWVTKGACAHADMRIARAHISNWGGLREFQHALYSLDAGSYAALLREIPNSNSGLTKPDDARLCLAELDRFRLAGPFGGIVELVDGDNGTAIHSRVEPDDGWLSTDGATGVSVRLTMDGMFQIERGQPGMVQHASNADVLFRSKSCRQAQLSAAMFCFYDLPSGKTQLCSAGIRDEAGRYPALLEVIKGLDIPARYAYCVEPLSRVFRAAIDTGHPVLWS